VILNLSQVNYALKVLIKCFFLRRESKIEIFFSINKKKSHGAGTNASGSANSGGGEDEGA
jgi:hypothetical protein